VIGPLYAIVLGFQVAVEPDEDLGMPPPDMIGPGAADEGEDGIWRGRSHGLSLEDAQGINALAE
jgi:hypothetical protein